jgi:hypothetical protein
LAVLITPYYAPKTSKSSVHAAFSISEFPRDESRIHRRIILRYLATDIQEGAMDISIQISISSEYNPRLISVSEENEAKISLLFPDAICKKGVAHQEKSTLDSVPKSSD